MKMASVLKQVFVLVLAALVLVACGGTPTPGGGGGGNPPGTSGDINGTYNGSFQIDDETNDVFIDGLTTFTVTNGKLSGTLTAGDSFDFPGDKGTVNATFTATSQTFSYDFTGSFDFATAPDYTLTGSALAGDESFLASQTLKRDGNFVGSFSIIAEKE